MNTNKNDDKHLPAFLQSAVEQVFSPQESSNPYSMRKPFIIISAIWFLCLFIYVQFIFGWSSFSALLPAEFVTFLAVVFISLAITLLLTTLIYRYTFTVSQAAAVEKTLSRVFFSQDESLLNEVITQPLQQQIQKMTKTTIKLSKQVNLLKSELDNKNEEFAKISEMLDNYFTDSLGKFNTGSQQFIADCQQAAETATKTVSLFNTSNQALQDNAQSLTDILNPLINETLATAEHLKNIVQDNKNYIGQNKSEVADFANKSREHLENLTADLTQVQTNLEKNFLQTADSCEEIYKRLDSGISHIENSLSTHKQLAEEQANLLDKNSTYLDNKLGEYGRLISLEVEAMVDRSSTLDNNVKNQLNTLTDARKKIEQVLDGANNSLEKKSNQVATAMEKIISNLDSELVKLNDFIKKTDSKNDQIQSTAEKITKKIGDISADLGSKVDDLKNRAIEAIDKFNEVSGVVQKNTSQLTESANIIVNKGKEGAKSLETQQENLMQTKQELEVVKGDLEKIKEALIATSESSSDVFNQYKLQLADFGNVINQQLIGLDDSKMKAERHLAELKQQYHDFSINNFLEESSILIENLENMAVDINGFFENTDEDELWKKFYNGDHAVFARHIARNLNRKQVLKIREEYEKNADFRNITNRYLGEFELLLTAAGKTEKPETSLAMLTGSDLGKIYYVTARALDRLD